MKTQFSDKQFDAVIAGAHAIRQIVSTGEMPALSHGWKVGTPRETYLEGSDKTETLVALGHDDEAVLRVVFVALGDMGMAVTGMELLGLNVTEFIFVKKPATKIN